MHAVLHGTLVGGGACGLPVTDGGIQPWRQSSKLPRYVETRSAVSQRVKKRSFRETTATGPIQGSDVGRGTQTQGGGSYLLQRTQVTRAGRLITKQGTTAKARERDLLSCGFAMAQVSGSGRRNLEHFTAWRVCRQVIRRSSTTAVERGIPV